jgi:hypothetical protein
MISESERRGREFQARQDARRDEWASKLGLVAFPRASACVHRVIAARAGGGPVKGCPGRGFGFVGRNGCWPPGTDHASLWLRADDRRAALFVSQPYHLHAEARSGLELFCRLNGLALQVDEPALGTSWYMPRSTLFVAIYRPDVFALSAVGERPAWSSDRP